MTLRPLKLFRGDPPVETFVGLTDLAAGGGGGGGIYALSRAILNFTETIGAGTYTALVVVPADARILEVAAYSIAGPWSAETKLLTAGDTAYPEGYINHTDGFPSDPYDPLTAKNDFDNTWQDAGYGGADYAQAAALYSSIYNSYMASGVLYPAGDTIAVTVVTTGAYDTGGIGAGSVGSNAGLLYAPGDTGTIDTGNGDAVYEVLTVGAGGAVTAWTLSVQGTGYSVGNDQATSVVTGSGDGNLLVDIDSIFPAADGVLLVEVVGFGVPGVTIDADKT